EGKGNQHRKNKESDRTLQGVHLQLNRWNGCFAPRIKKWQPHYLRRNRPPHRLHRHLHRQRRPHRRLLPLHASQRNHLLQRRRPCCRSRLPHLLPSSIHRHRHSRRHARHLRRHCQRLVKCLHFIPINLQSHQC